MPERSPDLKVEGQPPPGWPHGEPPEEFAFLDGLERFSQLLDELHDAPIPSALAWEGDVSGIGYRSLKRLLLAWRDIAQDKGPPTDLIVRIAKRLSKIVEEISRSPRKILKRQRVMTPINRMREMDVACAQWLTRQPGRTLLEKTGPKRSLLAVQRFESTDTLENRVFKRVLQRSVKQARHYLRLYEVAYPDHEYIHRVKTFLRLCCQVLIQPNFQEVSELSGLVKPNYALLHEPRYHQVWWAYEQLVRQQARRRQLWTCRHEAWSEMCHIALLGSLAFGNLNIRPSAHEKAFRHDVLIDERMTNGRRIPKKNWSPNWAEQRGALTAVCFGFELRQFVEKLSGERESVSVIVASRPAAAAPISFGILSPDITIEALWDAGSNKETEQFNLDILWHDDATNPKTPTRQQISIPVNLTTCPSFFDDHLGRWLNQ